VSDSWNDYEPENLPADPAELAAAIKKEARRKFPVKGGMRRQAAFVLKDLLVVRQIAYGELQSGGKPARLDANLMLRTCGKLMEVIETVHLKKPPPKPVAATEIEEDDLPDETQKQLEVAREKRKTAEVETDE
jgi:hypothetical protein